MDNYNLMLGNELFQKSYFKAHEKEFLELAEKGQTPKALYIGCSDSRVVPDLMTNSAPGDLFVVRNIGNFVAPYKPDEDFHSTASAIEYAVSVLKVKNIIVCGHTKCGAIEAIHNKSCSDDPELVHTKTWLTLGDSAKSQALLALGLNADKDILYRLTEKLSVISQIENLLTYPSVKTRIDSNEISVHGWIYDIESGEIEYYDPEISQFVPLSSLREEKSE
ncbi:MAG: carbonic anhydrase [Sulfurimonas sp. RIFOXYD12_FULL_33_39]|uniref:carbonic anhydrase n=1 Tax=unclassified Sulfurimonas TaxID=2623549 RepID=UPI0008D6D1DD|nr:MULTISPECIES: carbonic anhydrase [unclassified Sulfurimonas]OHE06681.1 MAG: carbonic anhydrase [Sulfurimonas sp. RIFCSPLOWO2_12_FULL_34_6]OHE10726.1 MAG: carbonic anhydrase [Sulfurimonas sp. RIFOXYD12_FULL_33_39]OHE13504.1 MAG: carbonic anhydrase [Sulfurimonas sp. RIFOXYD2_FULL_34_21]